MLEGPYSGAERKLLLAFDVGLTHSGISYCLLDPGKEPEIKGVHKFPGQELAGGNAKIPSVMYYGKDGQVRVAGAETERYGMDIIAEEMDWARTESFILHLSKPTRNADFPPLPLGKTAVEVLSDFLEYLNDCARQYILGVYPGLGTALWNGLMVHYILSHPNGWEGPQQALMRQAAEMAGLVTPNGRNQVTFITEGEASLHRCIDKGVVSDYTLRSGGITIVDAREETVNISAYFSWNGRRNFEEIAEPQYHFMGSSFVTEAAEEYMTKLLKDSRFHRDIPIMKQYFDQTTKRVFRDPADPYYIRFGSVLDKDVNFGINRGLLRLDGEVVASFFEPLIKCIVNGVLAQRRTSHRSISTVFLVGSFSVNDYLFQCVKRDLEPHGLKIRRPDAQINKLVADGAISKILDSLGNSPLEQWVEGSGLHDIEVFRKNAELEVVVPPSVLEPTSAPITATVVVPSQPSSPISPPSTNVPVVMPSTPPPPPPPQASLPVATSDHFDKLTDDNYLEWKMYMTAVLVSKGLLDVVDGSEGHPGGADGTKRVKKFRNKRARARAELILHVSPSQLIHCSHDDPVVIWNALATAHAAHKRVTINTLRRKLHKVRLEDDETMSTFIGRVRRMAFLVKTAGEDIDDDDVILFITAGLPSSYDSCITSLDALPDSEYNIDVISARLVSEYQQHSRSHA